MPGSEFRSGANVDQLRWTSELMLQFSYTDGRAQIPSYTREERQLTKKDSNGTGWTLVGSCGSGSQTRTGRAKLDLLPLVRGQRESYSSGSGCKLKSFSPAAFFSAYFIIQASQLLPAAVSRPENASAPISAYDTATFSSEFLG